jgi:predicted ATPase
MSDPANPFADLRKAWIEAGIIPDGPPPPVIELSEEERAAKVKAEILAQRLEKFKEQCPEQFRAKIKPELLPNLAAWNEADKWFGTFPGLWLWSEQTGRGKTRMLWRKFGVLHVERGRTVLKISGQALAEEYFRYHMEGDPRSFYRWVTRYDVVMIDDLDKVDMSDRRAPRMLRELFDEFYSHKSVVLVTANEPIRYFEGVIGESTSRRMRAVVAEIQF